MIEAYRRTGRLDGHCLCASVTIRIDGDYVAADGTCHCSYCQSSSGVLWAAFEASARAVTVKGDVIRYNSTDFAERTFCPRCGSNLWFRNTGDDSGAYELMPALFPETAGFPLISEIYIDRRSAYVPLTGDHRTATRADYEAKNRHVKGDLP